MQLTTQLAILQQSEYNWDRFLKWYKSHRQAEIEIEPEKWTPKLKLIQKIVTVLFFLPIGWRFKIALLMTQPGEKALRLATYQKAQQKISELRKKGLVVVAIAGSYGKTSTKHILYHTINPQVVSLMTPKNINTKLGISQVILNDLKPDHQVFFCELGEFNPGDLKALTEFIQPDWAVLTPIGHQHLELLGSFEKVVAEFQDFANFFALTPEHLLVAEHNRALLKNQNLTYYGSEPSSEWRTAEVKVSRAGTEYQVIAPGQTTPLTVFTPLFGEHQALNTLPTFWLAQKLKLPLPQITQTLAALPYIDRRHQPIFSENNILILDNSYNTNPDSVKESLKLLNQLQAGNRLLITAGFVEQGAEAERAHQVFGQLLASKVDYLGLFNAKFAANVLKGFTEAGGQADHVVQGTSQIDVVQKLQPFMISGSVVVFEGGYQEIHN